MDSAPCDGNFVDEQAAEPLDPWADAARATLPRGGVDHAEVHGEDGGSTRRAWRKGKHSDENAVGNPSGTVGEHGAEQDSYEPDDDEQYDASKHAWTEAGPWPQYDPTKHEWTQRWPDQTAWETSWNTGWETGWDSGFRRQSWSGATANSSRDGWEYEWTRTTTPADQLWEAEWSRTPSTTTPVEHNPWETEWNKQTCSQVPYHREGDFQHSAIPGEQWQARLRDPPARLQGDQGPGDGDRRGGLSERMSVPSFSADSGGDELGQSARSYIRQIDAWVRVTRTPPSQQAILLYQSLKGRAWIEAEELDVKELSMPDGVEKFKSWITERYQEIEVGKIAEALNGFFKKLRRGPSQTVREFNAAFDRSYARLVEIECRLPETARAWAYLSALSLSHSEELAILGSVNNEFVCSKLQRAAVLHEKSLRRPWDQRERPKPWDRGGRVPSRVNSANAAEAIPEDGFEEDVDIPSPANEDEAELFEAFMTAKAQYRDAVKNRNLEPDEVKRAIDNKIQNAKSRSFCSVCKQRGHWYRDPECPGKPPAQVTPKDNNSVPVTQTANISNEVFVTSGILSDNLLAIADSACTKSVTGTAWLQRYMDVLKAFKVDVPLLQENDNFKFGASRVYSSSYAVVVSFKVGNSWIMVKVSVIHGDLPLLLSRSVLAELGMVYNLKEHKADFEAVQVKGYPLMTTPTGHPAISVHPGGQGIPAEAQPNMWDANKCARGEILIVPGLAAYMAECSGDVGPFEAYVACNAVVDNRAPREQFPQIFYAKKISPEIKNLLISEHLPVESFVKWWNKTGITSDFWIETGCSLIRIHVTPRKTFFSPAEWKTSQSLLRENLLRVLGSIRETTSVSCHSQRGLPVAVDLWDKEIAASQTCHQCLWVGRTVFNRRPITPIRSPRVPLGNAVQGAMADEQDGTSCRGNAPWTEPYDEVDSGGTTQRDPGAQGDLPGDGQGAEGTLRDALGTSTQGSRPHRLGLRGEDNARDADPPHPRLPRDPGRHGDGDRPLQGEHVQANSSPVCRMGGPRREGQWSEHEPGPETIRSVVPEEDRGERPRVTADPPPDDGGPRALREGALHGIIDGIPILGSSVSDEQGGCGAEAVPSFDNLTKDIDAVLTGEACCGTSQHEGKDGSGRDTRSAGGDQSSGTEAGGAEGPSTQPVNYPEEKDASRSPVDYQYDNGGEMVINPTDDEGDLEQWSELEGDNIGAEVFLSEHVEKKISLAMANNDYKHDTLNNILEEIFGTNGEFFPRRGAKARPKAMGPEDSGDHKLVLGYYAYGNMRGICANTSRFASLCLYLKNYFLDKDPTAKWSSISLALNCKPTVHADYNNLKGTLNYLTTTGGFSHGGGLWQEGKDSSTSTPPTSFMDPKERPVKGFVSDARGKIVSFNADKLHSAEPWSGGNRWSITCFTSRGLAGSTQGERRRLRQWGFQLHDLRHLDRDRKRLVPPPPLPHRETGQLQSEPCTESYKPRRSVRKELWKSATRASAFITWSLASMTSASAAWTENNGEMRSSTTSVALLEIGGMNQTLEATSTFECLSAEPLQWEDVPSFDPGSFVMDLLFRWRPSSLWLHPPCGNYDHDEKKFFEVLDICGRWQVRHFGSLFVPVPLDDADQERRVRLQMESFGKVHKVLIDETAFFKATHNTVHEAYVAEGEVDEGGRAEVERLREGAAGITFDKKVPSDMAAALRRLHQNLGHPAREDLVRHLHHAGADRDVIKAAKSLECSTCARMKGPKSARPAAEPKLLEFGDVVGVDMMYAYDVDGKKIKLFSMVDHASSYQVVVQVTRQTGSILEKTFLKNWVQVFGAPKVITLDLERGIQDAFGRLADWYHIELRTSAGQAHWQSGFTERHGKWWKEIFARVVQEQTVRGDETEEAIGATSTAKNNLRRRCGWAPCQIVFGKNPRDEADLQFEVEEGGGQLLRTADDAQRRREAIRNAARIAFYQVRTEDKVRRGMSQKTRVKPRDLENGSMVLFWRKPANKKNGLWKGPGTIIGRQEDNYWVSHGGRCYLCAPEHLRRALPEEVGGLFALRATKDDLLRLVENNYDDPEVFPGDGAPEEDQAYLDDILADLSMPENSQDETGAVDMELDNGDLPEQRTSGMRRGAPGDDPPRAVRRRFSTKRAEEAYMLKRASTRRGREKQLEKEIPWSLIPESKRQLFIDAEHKQWEEHLRLGALRPLSLKESLDKKDCGRILSSRFAYRDKNLAKRRADATVEWKAKSRLVVSGHTDPDIASGALRTDSPTVSRTAVMCLLQMAASRTDENWGVSAGDVTAAFLNGEKLDRELYLKQPKHGLPGLHPDQLIKVEKGVFGLIDSPRKWWKKFKKDIQELTIILHNDKKAKFYASALDPCVFQLVELDDEGTRGNGTPLCYAAVHVDDILLVAERGVRDLVQKQLSTCFPVDEWEQDVFDFIGSHIETKPEGIFVSQSSYAANRLFEVEVSPSMPDDVPANPEQIADNRSLVGALSWLASQSRPDLACGVSMCQQLQAKPNIGDLRFSNLMARRALLHKDEGILLAKVPLNEIVFTVFHDAGWSNAPDSNADPVYFLYSEDERNGIIEEGPWVNKKRKTKKKNSSVASQLGALVTVHGKDALGPSGSVSSILEWRSHACDRVYRSMFGAETMGCIEGIELAQYVRAMFDSFLTGKVTRDAGKSIPLLAVTDCRSLFDHMHKDGLPRTPSDRRLAIDIACLRQSLDDERADVEDSQVPLVWVPTHLQRADVLTKPKSASDWWPACGQLSLPIKEGKLVLKQCKSEVASTGLYSMPIHRERDVPAKLSI